MAGRIYYYKDEDLLKIMEDPNKVAVIGGSYQGGGGGSRGRHLQDIYNINECGNGILKEYIKKRSNIRIIAYVNYMSDEDEKQLRVKLDTEYNGGKGYKCTCGSSINYTSWRQHNITKKHKKYLASQIN